MRTPSRVRYLMLTLVLGPVGCPGVDGLPFIAIAATATLCLERFATTDQKVGLTALNHRVSLL